MCTHIPESICSIWIPMPRHERHRTSFLHMATAAARFEPLGAIVTASISLRSAMSSTLSPTSLSSTRSASARRLCRRSHRGECGRKAAPTATETARTVEMMKGRRH